MSWFGHDEDKIRCLIYTYTYIHTYICTHTMGVFVFVHVLFLH